MDKQAKTVITEEGCFKGMDGLTYMERHLGYRLVLTNAKQALVYPIQQDLSALAGETKSKRH